MRHPDAAMEGFDSPTPNAEQAEAMRLLDAGKNVFLTGVAGTGKTFALDAWLRRQSRGFVAVTASTGIAATHIGGQTVHSWCGCGIANRKARTIADKWWWRERVRPVIAGTDVLVIDEVSMLDGVTFELVSDLCGRARGCREIPFGGLQVVLVGDMGQLTPVEEESKGFPFETDAWWDGEFRTVELRRVMRQSDRAFVSALQEVRNGTMSAETMRLFSSRLRAYDPEERGAVRLMAHNSKVDAINTMKLARLDGEERVFLAHDMGEEKAMEQLDKTCLSPKTLRLKVGARVMLTKNGPPLFVNGSMGYVEGWGERDGKPYVEVRIDDGPTIEVGRAEWKRTRVEAEDGGIPHEVVEAHRLQFPLRLAWAITIHKSQGMTIDLVSVDLSGVFAPGQSYVALSRARTLDGLNIEGWRGANSVMAHPTVMAFVNGTYTLPPRQEETLDMHFGE